MYIYIYTYIYICICIYMSTGIYFLASLYNISICGDVWK